VKKSIGYSVLLEDWDFKRQRVRTNKITLVNARTVNNYLNSLELNLLQGYTEVVSSEVVVTKSTIQGLINRITKTEVDVLEHKVNLDFLSFSAEFLNQKKPLIAPHEDCHFFVFYGLFKMKEFSNYCTMITH